MQKARDPFHIAGHTLAPGERKRIYLPLGNLYNHQPLELPLEIIHGKKAGPVLLVSACVHGDEINGVEIITRLLARKQLRHIHGTLVIAPVVNVYGFLNHSRYLPDRRDLNRCFPGSEKGSMAARLANLFTQEVLSVCTHGIDLHTGAIHRSNLPQIRVDLDQEGILEMARAFQVPVILDNPTIPNSMRYTAQQRGIPLLLYEAGEALRFDESAIRGGVKGVLGVMRYLGMLPQPAKNEPLKTKSKNLRQPVISRSSYWLRSPQGGVLRTQAKLGQWVKKGDILGHVADPFGEQVESIKARTAGIIVGISYLPLVEEGTALFHVAQFAEANVVEAMIERFHEQLEQLEQGFM